MRQIVVTAYDPDWPKRFERERDLLTAVLHDELAAVHHIGSTAVSNLWAKPIIDLLAEAYEIDRIDGCNDAMVAAGYLPKGENGLPGRRFFLRGTEEQRLAHVHIFQVGHPDIMRHLALRDYLRAHPAARQEYGAMKRALAGRYPTDADGYVAGKDALVKALERQALSWCTARAR